MKTLTTRRFSKAAIAAFVAIAFTGCAGIEGVPMGSGYGHAGYSNNAYRGADALGEMAVRYGTVRSVRPVMVEQGQSGVGIASGAVIGGLLGNKVGKGRGRKAATLLGAVAGGMGGAAVESNVRNVNALEIVVQLDSGHEVAVVQANNGDIVTGDRVRLTGSGNNVRVSR